jgi:hypothetical protein
MQRGQAAQPEAAQLLQPAPEPAVLEPELPPEAARNSEDAPDGAASAPSWATHASIGVRLGSQPGLGLGRWGFGVTAGPVLELKGLRLAAALAFDVFPSIQVERARDLVRFWEWSFGAALHAQARFGSLWLGARAGPQLVGLQAFGRTAGGIPGEKEPTSWSLLTGLDAELPLTPHVSLATSLQLQSLADRLHLDVNRATLVDAGRVRARITLDLLARF